ncbi:SDR family NAD(P)-dependent oxidoreductase [Patulibacter medicamentivorans]|uniref:SDR family NAD(P)-dependent oxidoreductase n=1 Tax=Patulibacter medicamentivorans TaxID=1097667 RepID=UPI0002EB75C0|nr:SDR family oxidoreductase [Patulibacter medicamentivorans]
MTVPCPSLTDRTVLLTGASRGIGAATARTLAEHGARLVAQYRSGRDGAERATAGLDADRRLLLAADFAEPGAARRLWRDAVAWRGRIDAVVVNAASLPQTPFDGSDDDWDGGWEQAMRVNVLEPAALIREAVAHFLEHGGGTLVVLSSWAAEQGSRIPSLAAYAASKAALRNLAQTVARTHAADGILVHVLAPGVVRTEMAAASDDLRPGGVRVEDTLASGRLVEPDEVARLIALLASGAFPNLSGATLDMNGASYVR